MRKSAEKLVLCAGLPSPTNFSNVRQCFLHFVGSFLGSIEVLLSDPKIEGTRAAQADCSPLDRDGFSL